MVVNNVVAAFDIDGALIESVEEGLKRSQEAWKEIEGTTFPMNPNTFLDYRWSVKMVEHYFQNAKAYEEKMGNLPQDYKGLEKVRSKYDASEFSKKFYEARKRAMAKEEAWLEEFRLYDGIKGMLEELDNMGVVKVVATAKDKQSTLKLLNHFDIEKYWEKIYAREGGHFDKKQHFTKIFNDFKINPSNIFFYDDLPEWLDTAKAFGFTPVAAPQGYGRDKDLAEYINARPEEFASVVASITNKWSCERSI